MILTLLSCARTLAQLDPYLDRELSAWETKMVRGHLKICHACEEKFAFEQQFADALRTRFEGVSELELRALKPLSKRILAALDELETDELETENPHHV